MLWLIWKIKEIFYILKIYLHGSSNSSEKLVSSVNKGHSGYIFTVLLSFIHEYKHQPTFMSYLSWSRSSLRGGSKEDRPVVKNCKPSVGLGPPGMRNRATGCERAKRPWWETDTNPKTRELSQCWESAGRIHEAPEWAHVRYCCLSTYLLLMQLIE